MPHWLVLALSRYGYLALVAGVFLENVGVPVPGETVLLAAGFFARTHLLRLGIVIPCAIVAAIAGDNLGYWIGRRGGRKFALRYGRFVGLNEKRLDLADRWFRRHGARSVFFGRFVTGIRVVAAIFAGITRIPWPKFLLFNAAGAVVWGTAIALLGFAFGHSWHLLERWVGRTGLVLVAAVVLAGAFVLVHRRRRHA